MRPVHLMHLMHRRSIANQDTMSIWRCVLICLCFHPESWRHPGTDLFILYVLTASGALPLHRDRVWCPAAASWQPLVLRAVVLVTHDSPYLIPTSSDTVLLLPDAGSLSPVVRASFIWPRPVQISLLCGPASGSHDPEPSSPDAWWLLPDYTPNTLHPLILTWHVQTLCAAISWLWYGCLWCQINYFWRYCKVSQNAFSFEPQALVMSSTIFTCGSVFLGIWNNYYNIWLYKQTISYVLSHTLVPFPSSSVPGSLWTVSSSSGSKIPRLRYS